MNLIAWVIRSCLKNCLETSGNHKEVIGEAFFKKLHKATPKKSFLFLSNTYFQKISKQAVGLGSAVVMSDGGEGVYAAVSRVILRQLYARATSVHSVARLARPRRWKRVKPMALLMMPKTGSTVCLRKA